MSPAGLNILKRTGCPVRKYIALCEWNSSSLLSDVMKWLSTWVLWCQPIFKKMVEIYITFCPKCVSCELLHLIWPDKYSPLYSTRKQATDLHTKHARQLIGTYKRTGRKRSLPTGTAFPNIYHTLQKISARVKVCALCIEKKKKNTIRKG
jgi:hypothetical protein